MIGAQLLDAAGYSGPRVLQSVAESASPDACRDLGRDLAADAPLTALLVLGDGSARRSAAAPGYLDERAEPFDTIVEQALRDGDLPALAALDPDLARDLLAAGRPAWQALAGALPPPPPSTPASHHPRRPSRPPLARAPGSSTPTRPSASPTWSPPSTRPQPNDLGNSVSSRKFCTRIACFSSKIMSAPRPQADNSKKLQPARRRR